MERLSADYEGVALSLVDALTTLAVMGNASEFAWAARWLSANVRPGACGIALQPYLPSPKC